MLKAAAIRSLGEGMHEADPQSLLLLRLDTPIDLSGAEHPERLVASEGYLRVRGGADCGEVLREWVLADVETARLETTLGSSFLQVRTDGRWADVLRWPGDPDSALVEVTTAIVNSCAADPAARRPASSAAGRPAADMKPVSSNALRSATRLGSLLRPFRARVALLLGLSLVAVGIDVAPPLLQAALVDRVLRPAEPAQVQQAMLLLAAIVAGLLLFRLAGTVVGIWKGAVSSQIGTMLTASLRDELVKKLSRLPLAFHNRHQVGALMSRVAYDTETMHTLVYHITSGFLLQSMQLVGIGVALFWLNPRLAVITMLPMPLIVVGSWYFTRYLSPRHNHYWDAVGRQASALMGMLTGIRVVKTFVQEDRENERFGGVSRRLRDSRQTVDLSTSTFTALLGFVFALGGLAVWYVGGRDVLHGTMSLGALMAFFAYLAMFYTPLTTIGESTSWFSSFFTTASRIFELLDAQAEADEPPGSPSLEQVRGRIEFRNVSFAYDRDRPVLQDVSFTVQPGEMIGVVGRSGSGKSTLVSLIARLYEIDSGTLLVDGVDVRQLDRRQLRRRIGMVPQEPFLFRGTVADNILYGNAAAEPGQLLQAAKYADAHDFVMRLPLGYETQLGEGGTGVSGGERQRLSIARALLFDPAILILDEATASIDAESERAICDAIRRFSQRRTTIVIAHRLSTLRDADRLLIFDQGRLIEQGSHAELVAHDGLYAALARIQGMLTEGHRGVQRAMGSRAMAGQANPLDPLEPAAWIDAILPTGSEDPRRGESEGCELNWLDPGMAIESGPQGELRVRSGSGTTEGVYAVCAFPASRPHEFVSLRHRTRWGAEAELGIMRNLEDFSVDAQHAVRRSLARRYLLRRIREVRQVRTQGQWLELLVLTEGGSTQRIQMEKQGEGYRPYGREGLLLVDTRGNYFVIPNRRALPRRQQRLVALYFGA
jgi:ATP-binding cassette subfamily B protein